jgi:hypothetical protein
VSVLRQQRLCQVAPCHELNDDAAGVAVWCDVSNIQKGKVAKESNLIGWSGAFGPNLKDSAPLALMSDAGALPAQPLWACVGFELYLATIFEYESTETRS